MTFPDATGWDSKKMAFGTGGKVVRIASDEPREGLSRARS